VELELQAVEAVLGDETKVAVENGARAYTAFQTLLDHWMMHSLGKKRFYLKF
jgi:hypothetical protein